METYQEEYGRIRKEYVRLERQSVDKRLTESERDEAKAKMSQISVRLSFLKLHVEEAARRIDELTDLRNDITVGRSRLDAMSRIVNGHTDAKDITKEELDIIRQNFYRMTREAIYKSLKREKVPGQIRAFGKQYVEKEERFHRLYKEYEEFEKIFREKDPLYVEKGDKAPGSEKPDSPKVETPEEKLKREQEEKRKEEAKKEEERKRQAKIEELKKKKEEIESKIKELEYLAKKLEDMIQSGKYEGPDLEGLRRDLNNLRGEIRALMAKLLEIGGMLDALKQEEEKAERNEDEKKTQGETDTQNPKKDNPKGKVDTQDSKKDNPKGETGTQDHKKDNGGTQEHSSPQPGIPGNGSSAPQTPGGGTVYSSGGAVYPSSQTTAPVAKDKQLKKKSKIIDKIKETVEKIKQKAEKIKEEKELDIAKALEAQEISEKVRRKNPKYEVIKEEDKRADADLQLLDFPHAKVVGHYFYHTVQREDKIQYVKEPIEGMERTEEALKRKIIQLQDRYGDVARERKGKKIHPVDDLIYYEGKEQEDFFARKSYQQLLKDPDKIIKKYLGISIGNQRRDKIIQLMCGLEAANTAQEAGLACLEGLHDDLFDWYRQKEKSIFLEQLDTKNAELLKQHIKEHELSDAEKDIDYNAGGEFERDENGHSNADEKRTHSNPRAPRSRQKLPTDKGDGRDEER